MTRPRFGILYLILLPVLVLPTVVMLWLPVRGDVAEQLYYDAVAASAADHPALAREFFRMAASYGHLEAAYNLGMMYLLGLGGPADAEAAREQFELAVLYGSTDAEYQLGLLDEARRPDPDYNGAALHYNRAALAGHVEAQAALGRFYENGFGVNRSPILAAEFYRKAAAAGHAQAQCALAELLLETEPHQEEEAFRLFTLAAKAGFARAYTGLGLLHERGWGGHAPDRDKALACYRKAAELGDVSGMVDLGDLIAAEKSELARKFYEQAAERGFAPAWHRLGLLHFNGTPGGKPDFAAARQCFERAAALGNAASWINLGIMYELGRGVAADGVRAEQCYRKALALGHPDAPKRLAALGGDSPPEQ